MPDRARATRDIDLALTNSLDPAVRFDGSGPGTRDGERVRSTFTRRAVLAGGSANGSAARRRERLT
jgi:hypothetical protein